MDAYKSAGYLDYWAGGGGTFAFVDESPYGVASKVLKLSTINGANQDQLMIRNTLAYANSTFAKFEADILVNPVQNTTLELRFMNNTLASADRTAYTFYLNVGADGNGSITGSGINTVEASAVAGNWFRFRAEYHDVSETQFKILIYYNDMLVAGTDAINKPKGADHASSLINQVLVASSSTSVADIYLDNVKLSHDAPAYTPDLSDTAGRETYEPGDSIDAFTYDLWVNNAGTPLPTIEAAPYGVSSYVSFADNSARAYLNIGFKKTASTTAKMYRFETDMMITNAAANALIKGDIGGDKVKFALSVSGNTITLNSQQNNSSPISVVAPTGEWFRFTVECYVDASGNNVVRYLINEQQVGTTYASTVPLSGEHRIRFIADANKGADIYFDNTKVEFVTE